MRKIFKRKNDMGTVLYENRRNSWFFNRTSLMLLLMALVMWQCEKDDYVEVTSDCPVVISTTPESESSGVPLSQILTATFNEKMNPATITRESFLLEQNGTLVHGTVSYNESVASFKPSTSLLPNTVYTGIVKCCIVKDEVGNSLQTDYEWTFTTNMSPGVIYTEPLNNATDVAHDQVIAAKFSMPMDTSSLNMATFTLSDGEIPIAGVISYSDTTAFFTPTNWLTPETVYTATITSEATTESGTSLESDYVWSFNTGGIPVITFTDPENLEEDVALNKTVIATFSEPMDPATLNNSTFTIKQGAVFVSGNVSTDGTTVSFNPDGNLLYGTTYTAMISDQVKNTEGKPLTENYIWTFTTNNLVPPTVVSTDPERNERDVELNKNISATFSVPMDQAIFNTSTFTLKQGTTVIPGTVSYNGSTATFNPDNNFSYGTSYTATISGGVENQEGIAMGTDYEWTFETEDAVSPTVVSTDPDNVETGVELDKTISAAFSVPMDENTFNASTFMIKQAGNTVNGEISYNGNTASFNPDGDLEYGTTYIVTITTSVTNTEGTPMANNYVWAFTTMYAPAPTVISTDPASNENGVILDNVITATFSEPMDQYTFSTTTFTLENGSEKITGSVSLSGSVATFAPAENLLSGESYTATITVGVENTYGTHLAENYTWNFNTVAPLGPTAVDLKTASRFGILAGEQIENNTGATEVRNMDVGIMPGLRADITGFPPASVINGDIYAADDGTSVSDMLLQAQIDLTDAYTYAEQITSPAPVILGFDIGGETLTPGLYKSQSTMLIQTGNLILDGQGDANAVWIFQIASGLNTIGGNGGNVVLTNGAQANNVFWQVGDAVVIGENTTFNGNIMALSDISVNRGAIINGRLLARQQSVFVNTVIINKP
jgi:hypothetical protein